MTYVGDPIEDFPATDEHRRHNQPPLDQLIVEQFEDKIDQTEGLRQRIRDLMDRGTRLPDVTDEETAGKMGDFIKMVSTAADRVDTIRTEIKAPYLAATRSLDGKAKAYDADLDKLRRAAREKLSAYVAEQDRKRREAAAEEAARAAAERAAAQPSDDIEEMVSRVEAQFGRPSTGPAPARSEPIARGDYGARVGTRTVWKAEIVDVKKLPKAVLDHPKVVEAILSVLNQQVRSGIREIKGARVIESVEASVR